MPTFIITCLILLSSIEAMALNYLTEKVINVRLSKLQNTCDVLVVNYSLNTNRTIKIPNGTTGLAGENFLYSVFTLRRGNKVMPMKLGFISKGAHAAVSQDFEINGNGHYRTEIELNKYFEMDSGGFYFQYYFMWNTRQEGENVFSSEAYSDRYYIEVDSNGCFELLNG